MAYPPTIYPPNRQDDTPSATNHPADHNQLSNAVSDIINELGSNPSGPQGTVQERVKNLENNKLAKSGGTMTGSIDMGGNPITNLADAPTGSNSAVPQQWANDRYAIKAGTTFSGDVVIGTEPASGFGLKLQADGYLAQAYNTVDVASIMLRRGLAANAAGQVFIRFEKGTAPGTLISTIAIGSPNDRIVISNCTVTAPSDYRMKERVGPINDAAARIAALARRAFRGRWKGNPGEWDMLSAHDIAVAAPYAVTGEKDGDDTQQVAWGDLVPLVVSALGNALDRIDALERA